MFVWSLLSCALQFIGLYTLLANQTIIPKEYTVKPVDVALEHLQWAYDAHLSSTIGTLHEGFKIVRGIFIHELHEMIDVNMIKARLTAHMTEGYEVLQYAHKRTSEYTKKGIDFATTYHKEQLIPAIDETMKATYRGIDMAEAYHRETVIPAIEVTIKSIQPHLNMATKSINQGYDFAKDYTNEIIIPALDNTYETIKPHLDKYTTDLYKGIDIAKGYTEESLLIAYVNNIKPTMDHIVSTSTEHVLSLYETSKNYTTEALKPHIEHTLQAARPYMQKHVNFLRTYVHDLSTAIKTVIKEEVNKQQQRYDDITTKKLEESEVIQQAAVTENMENIQPLTRQQKQEEEEEELRRCNIRVDNQYIICPETIEAFKMGGLTILNDLVSEQEMADLEVLYDRHMQEGSAEKYQKDFCDMSKPFSTPREEYSVINAMLPRRYSPEFQGNIYEQVAESVAKQLFPDVEMILDYDQLLDKMPGKNDAVFAWHQDMAYWPNTEMTPDTRTVTFSLAFDSTNKQNGCIHYLPGSGSNKTLRSHKPLGKDRDEAHAIAITIGNDETIHYAEVKRGSASIHDEWVVHGSSGNKSNGSRRTYVIAFRTKDTVQRERAAGFTHSHNDEVNWDQFNQWDK